METLKAKVDQAGRVLIPSFIRRALNMGPGEEVFMRLEEGELRILSFKKHLENSRQLLAFYNKENEDLVEALLKMKEEEREKEERELDEYSRY